MLIFNRKPHSMKITHLVLAHTDRTPIYNQFDSASPLFTRREKMQSIVVQKMYCKQRINRAQWVFVENVAVDTLTCKVILWDFWRAGPIYNNNSRSRNKNIRMIALKKKKTIEWLVKSLRLIFKQIRSKRQSGSTVKCKLQLIVWWLKKIFLSIH